MTYGPVDAAEFGPVLLAGHSSGTQVPARAAVQAGPRRVVAVVLASPTVAPIARPLPRMLVRWRLDGQHDPPGLTGSHLHEWRRAGVRGLLHLVRVHLRDRIEQSVPEMTVLLLVLPGGDDRLGTAEWARGLAAAAPVGRYEEVPGAHTFVWADRAAHARGAGPLPGRPTRWSGVVGRLR